MKYLFITGFLSSLLLFFAACHNSGEKKIKDADSTGTVTKIDPNQILMTYPTIENALPEFESKSDLNNLLISRDEWRQIEFITKAQDKEIFMEIDSINYILEHKSHKAEGNTAFKAVHVRKLITNPLTVSLDKIIESFGDTKTKINGLSIKGHEGHVKNGFSFSLNGVHYYGLKDESNNASVFCIYGADSDEQFRQSMITMSKFMEAQNLYLIDWVGAKVIEE